ncbi:MAG: flagellar filament capping protein FliD [Microbacteriaceae bacterium]
MAAIDGLFSGLQTADLINSLMQLEANPQTLLKQKLTKVGTAISAFQTLNSTVANLGTRAAALTTTAKIDAFKATSSDSSVTVKTNSGVGTGTLSFTVGQTAQGQTAVSAAMTAWGSDPAVLTITGADGEAHEISAASGSLADVASAVNSADLGITATRVAAGKNGAGEQQYRLQFTSNATGAEQSFTAHVGTAAEVEAGTATDLFTNGGAVVHAARDASITLWPGSDAAQVVTSSTNTFAAVIEGVDLTVSKTSADPVTVGVTRDASAISSKVNGLVTNLTTMLSYITSSSAVTTATDGSTSGGVFTGDSTVRDTKNRMTSAFSAPLDGISPSEYGITLDKKGAVTFDSAKFEAALAKDPAKSLAAVAELAARVESSAKTLSDPVTGTITAKVTGQESQSKSLTQRIEKWDTSLATRRATLERTYASLEVTLSNLTAQGSWLTSQLAGLPTSYARSNNS